MEMSLAGRDIRNLVLALHFGIRRGWLNRREMGKLRLDPLDEYRPGGFVFSADRPGNRLIPPARSGPWVDRIANTWTG